MEATQRGQLSPIHGAAGVAEVIPEVPAHVDAVANTMLGGDALDREVEIPVMQGQQDEQGLRNSEAAKKLGREVRSSKEAQRRLMRDFQSLQRTLASEAGVLVGITAHPIDGDMFHWRAVISGPSGTVWEGGLFKLDLRFTSEYPLAPPRVRFLTKDVFHPNIYVDGNLCMDTLKSDWSPTLDVEALLLSVTSLLSDPNPHSAANAEAARVYCENKEHYNEKVRQVVEDSLEQSFTDDDE